MYLLKKWGWGCVRAAIPPTHTPTSPDFLRRYNQIKTWQARLPGLCRLHVGRCADRSRTDVGTDDGPDVGPEGLGAVQFLGDQLAQ